VRREQSEERANSAQQGTSGRHLVALQFLNERRVIEHSEQRRTLGLQRRASRRKRSALRFDRVGSAGGRRVQQVVEEMRVRQHVPTRRTRGVG
jgi:hypothetical protein